MRGSRRIAPLQVVQMNISGCPAESDLLSVSSVSPELYGLTELTSCVIELDWTDCQDFSLELKLTD
jgi:hypothetical protein